MSASSLQAKPARREATPKRIVPAMNRRRRPRRSAARPPSRRKPPNRSAYALMTHCRSSWENPRSVWIDGSATFTTATSSTTMNCTVQRRARASHLRRDDGMLLRSPFRNVSTCLRTLRSCFRFASTAFHTKSVRAILRSVMAKRFEQYCPVAHAMSLVGERWALLVVRELLKGPRRYTDLAGGLPGIGTNVLATRLRELEAAGVVGRRRLPPPAASTVYELTEYGAQLEE